MLTFLQKQEIDRGNTSLDIRENKSPRIPIEVDRAVSVNDLYEGYVPSTDATIQLLGDLLKLPYTIESLKEYFNIVASDPSYRYYPKIQHSSPDPETLSGRIFLRETKNTPIPEYSYLVFLQTGNIIKYSLTPSQKKRRDLILSLNDRELSILRSLYDATSILEIIQFNQSPIEAYLLYARENPKVSILTPVMKGIGMTLPSFLTDDIIYDYILDNIILYRDILTRTQIYSQTMTDDEILTYLGPETIYFDRNNLVDQISAFLLTGESLGFFVSYHLLPTTYNKIDTFGRLPFEKPYLLYGTGDKNRWIALDELLKLWQTNLFSRIQQDGKYTTEELEKLLTLLPKFSSVFADDLSIRIKDSIFPRVQVEERIKSTDRVVPQNE